MPRPVRRKMTTPAARGGALVFMREMLLPEMLLKCSPPGRALARGGGDRRQTYPDGEASCCSVRAARCRKQARLCASQCFDHALEREFKALVLRDVGEVARANSLR